MKQCAKCKEYKEESEFSKDNKAKDKKRSYCKSCSHSVTKENKRNNQDREKEYTKNRREAIRKYADSFRIQCEKCGDGDKNCLDFRRPNKEVVPMHIIITKGVSLDKIASVANSCRVMCANCRCKEYFKKTRQRWPKQEKTVWFNDFVSRSYCVDCGESDRRCLEFHHLRDKLYNIGHMTGLKYSLDELKAEIEKCVVVCANCHRKRHPEMWNK